MALSEPNDAREQFPGGLNLPQPGLHESEWLSVTLYSIGDAVIATNTSGCVTFMNPVAESLTGWSDKEAAGQPLDVIFNIINEDTRQTVESPVPKALREGVVVGLANHTLLIARDGTERPIDDSAAPIRNAAGQVAGVVLVFRDISERKVHERALLDALQYAQSILLTLREPFLVLGKDLRVVSANRAFYQTFQVTQENTEGCRFDELGTGQWNIPRLRQLLEEVLPEDHTFEDFVVEQHFPAIGSRIMLLNARRIRKPNDHAELILLAIEDVTERRAWERRLSESEIRYRRLFEAARDGILLLDADTMVITDANPYMSELLGYTLEQFKGKELWEIGLFQDKTESLRAVQQLREADYVRYENLPLQNAHGQIQEVEFICNIYQEDYHAVAQCNIRDITERKRMERQIEQQARDLADLNRRKDEFVAMLSHELRNPMAPIFNALQLIGQEGGENTLQREARGVIDRQMRHLSRLVDDLLEVARITTGRIHLHLERVNLNGIIERAVERVRPLIERRKQNLSVTLIEQVVWLDADSTRMEQVLGNLLTNASKYNDAGGKIWLTVEVPDGHVVIRVQDNGIGMAPDLLPHIFDLFTQADKSLDRSEGGLGIGLALAKNLVELHQGMIKVHSDGIGRGSEFTVRLPLDRSSGGLDESIPRQRKVSDTKSLRILVVDDNVDAAKMAAMLLRSWGHEVRTANDGPSALQRARGFHPHVVLLDIGLPDMDGYEVARHIRRDANLKGVRLIAVTGYGQDSDRQRAKEAGFDVHMVKPVEHTDLKKLLDDVQPLAE